MIKLTDSELADKIQAKSRNIYLIPGQHLQDIGLNNWFYCKVHKKPYQSSIYRVTRKDYGTCCPDCTKEKINHTKLEKTKKKLANAMEEKNIRLAEGEVVTAAHTRCAFECITCNYKWVTKPHKIYTETGCLKCHNRKRKKNIGKFRKRKFTDAFRELARRCYAAGLNPSKTARLMNVSSSDTIKVWVDKEWAERKKQRDSEYYNENKESIIATNSKWRYSDYGQESYKKAHHVYHQTRRSIEYNCRDVVHMPEHPDADKQGFVEYDIWHYVTKEDYPLLMFEGANEAVTFRKKQQQSFEKMTGVQWSLDHLIPLSKGGTHQPENFQNLTKNDNSSKNNRVDYTAQALFCRRIFKID